MTFINAILLALNALLLYALSSWVGVEAAAYEPNTFAGVYIASLANIIYKIGHLPLSVGAGIITSIVVCHLTKCTTSLNERERDVIFFLVCAVVFIGLCTMR